MGAVAQGPMTRRSRGQGMLLGTWLAVLGATSLVSAENWEGIERGGLCHNAIRSDVNPSGLVKAWHRSFTVSPIGDQAGPNNEMRLACGRGSRNLTLVDGMIALVAIDEAGAADRYHCTVIDAADGETKNWIRVRSSRGNHRAYKWPYYCVSMSHDNITGIVNTHWDAASQILFFGQGAYNSSYTAYLPLANMPSFGGTAQEGVPAYQTLARNHPGFQDAFGRTRSEQITVFGPGERTDGMQPYTWGLAAAYLAGGGTDVKYDVDHQTVFGRQGSSYYNTSSYFVVDTDGELIGNVKGAGWGHNTGGDLYLFNKYTGMKVCLDMPELDGKRLRPFTSQGAVIGNGRVFCAGAATGSLGIDRPEGRVPRMDQGLYLWAYDYTMADSKPNGGYSGAGTKETVTLTPAFVHMFPSRFTPTATDIETYGQSYYECDGFYRNKAMMIDGKSVWFAWKPSQEDPVELIHADENGAKAYSLDVGQGAKGVDVWPKISLTEVNGHAYIVYFTGYARHRKRFVPADPIRALRQVREDAGLPPVPADVEAAVADDASTAGWNGFWTGLFYPPRCSAALAVFDVAAERVVYTYDVSANHPDIPSNEFWTQVDKTQMVVTERWAHVAWVDTTAAEAALKVISFDVTASTANPIVNRIPLGFASADNAKSALFDLIAADSHLYGLVTQSARLWIRDPRWKAQHVVAMQGAQSGVREKGLRTLAPTPDMRVCRSSRGLRIVTPAAGRLRVRRFGLDGRCAGVLCEGPTEAGGTRDIRLDRRSHARSVSVLKVEHSSAGTIVRRLAVAP